MTRLIKDRLNIDIDLVWKSDDYVNKLAMQIVADDLPDIYARLDILFARSGIYNFLQFNHKRAAEFLCFQGRENTSSACKKETQS